MNEIEKMDPQKKEIYEAIKAADDALRHLEKADGYLKSARNWGVLDILGGNLITGLFKHGKMSSAEGEIREAKYSLQRFCKELQDVKGYSSIHINELVTIGDFLFDGLVFDVIAQAKIAEARSQCKDAINMVKRVRAELKDRL